MQASMHQSRAQPRASCANRGPLACRTLGDVPARMPQSAIRLASLQPAAHATTCGMHTPHNAAAALGGVLSPPVLHCSAAAGTPSAALHVQAAAGGRCAWRSACPDRTTAAPCSAVAVHAGKSAGGVPMASSPEERRERLRTLINEAATERQVSDEDVSLLDEEDLGVLVKEKWTTKTVLLDTPYDELVAIGVSRGVARVLKRLFPGPITEGEVDQAIDAGPLCPRATLRDEAVKLARHEDDPTMYTVQYPDGRTTLFHDPTDVVGQLRHYLSEMIERQWCSADAGRHLKPLYISGGIKSGKTFMMNVIVPAVMAEMPTFASASSIQINASTVYRRGGYDALCESLLAQVREEARAKNITTPALSDPTVGNPAARLIRIFKHMDVPLTIQLDEVQHLLSPRLDTGQVDRSAQLEVAQLLKTLWCYSSKHCQWTVTGSGMALLWVHLALLPANGISPLTHKEVVHLPYNHSKAARTQVLRHMLAVDGKPCPEEGVPPVYRELLRYAVNCAMLAFAYDGYNNVQPMRQHLDQLDSGKMAQESVAEWRDIVRFEFDEDQLRALAGLYNCMDGCDLTLLESPGLVKMLGTLTTPVKSDPERVFLTSHFHRAGLAMCVTLDGKMVDPFSRFMADRRLHLCDAFVQMSLIGNKAKKLVRDPKYQKNNGLLAELLAGPAQAMVEKLGSAAQWRTKSWFKKVLYAAENQGPRIKTAAADEAEVLREYPDGTAAAYLKELDIYSKRQWAMVPERHLAWYLNMLRNALGHAEDSDATLSPAEAPATAFTLLLRSPVVQPTATILERFEAIREKKLT